MDAGLHEDPHRFCESKRCSDLLNGRILVMKPYLLRRAEKQAKSRKELIEFGTRDPPGISWCQRSPTSTLILRYWARTRLWNRSLDVIARILTRLFSEVGSGNRPLQESEIIKISENFVRTKDSIFKAINGGPPTQYSSSLVRRIVVNWHDSLTPEFAPVGKKYGDQTAIRAPLHILRVQATLRPPERSHFGTLLDQEEREKSDSAWLAKMLIAKTNLKAGPTEFRVTAP
ncbi:hypothetical protein FB451DRAFT_1174248 [Mycena latifolia]|nr:hypothetical protein FB451DRAFT_1174248 [Mycena latifolia]